MKNVPSGPWLTLPLSWQHFLSTTQAVAPAEQNLIVPPASCSLPALSQSSGCEGQLPPLVQHTTQERAHARKIQGKGFARALQPSPACREVRRGRVQDFGIGENNYT